MSWRNCIFAFALLLASNEASHGDELGSRLEYWRREAFECALQAPAFPSKEVLNRPAECDDGDMTLFNGLLCSSGDPFGCDAVARSQGDDGRWWRSPRRIGWEAPQHDVSFSPDQSLGVLLFAIATGQKDRLARWLAWIENNRPCEIAIAGRCLQRGWLRFCRDDFDKRCSLRPADCVRIELTAQRLGIDGSLCRRVMKELQLPESMLLPLDDFLLSSAAVNDIGYPLHLAAVGLFLARQSGFKSDKVRAATEVLVARQSENAFFLFLRDGNTPAVQQMLFLTCPATDRPSGNRFQWTWERETKTDAWKESMYWDCIFLGRLLQ